MTPHTNTHELEAMSAIDIMLRETNVKGVTGKLVTMQKIQDFYVAIAPCQQPRPKGRSLPNIMLF